MTMNRRRLSRSALARWQGCGCQARVMRQLMDLCALFTKARSIPINSEKEIGSLEPGKLADLVVLESDPRKVEPKQQIADIKISQTWMDGKQVYGS